MTPGRRNLALLAVATLAVAAYLVADAAGAAERRRAAALAEIAPALPRPARGDARGYVGSEACKECHASEHATWAASHHKRMTEPAVAATVLGSFDGEARTFHGRTYRFTRDGEAFYVEMPDPTHDWKARGGVRDPSRDAEDPPPRVRRRVVMTTGSHHQQVYWVEGGLKGRLDYVPIVWLVAERAWRPLRDVFLWYEGRPEHLRLWNDTCIACHGTDGAPKPVPAGDDWARETTVADLGIACEACHGPGSAHVAARAAEAKGGAAASRAGGPAGRKADPTIVDPRRLDARRSSEICGLCHAVTHSIDQERWYREGYRYRPGDDLEKTEIVLRPGEPSHAPYFAERSRDNPGFVADSWWPDGHMRVSGREYSDHVGSPCFKDDAFACTSCHSMHDYVSTDDQLRRTRGRDDACTQCHGDARYASEAHVLHAPGSEGASCVACHMPRTSYGLLKVSRSHRVSSPSVATTLATGRPNACNLCHLDRSLSWTQDVLERRYGAKPAAIPEDRRDVAAGVRDLVAGDASVRAIAAWHAAAPDARAACGDDWQAPFLAALLEDEYSAVRFFARRSLGAFREGAAAAALDDLGPPARRAEARAAVEAAFLRAATADPRRRRDVPALLLGKDGATDRAAYERLVKARDDRKMDLAE